MQLANYLQKEGQLMLLEFRVSNYKSFKDEMIFSMEPAPKQKGLDYSLLKERIGTTTYTGLCSAVIYGPNAAGKTNIIGAMDTFKSIVLRGNIRNSNENHSPNTAAISLEFIPNSSVTTPRPVDFSVKFTTDGMLVEYSFSADIGVFLSEKYPRRIVSETLSINKSLVFSRTDCIAFGDLNKLSAFFSPSFFSNSNTAIELANENLDTQELFLCNGFRTTFSPKLVSIIQGWLKDRFVVVYRANSIQLNPDFTGEEKDSVYIENTLNSAASSFGANSNDLGFIVKDNNKKQLCSVFRMEEGNIAIPANIYESYGTIRFINLFPLIVDAILYGGTLIVDEFDASIHPMALMNIINIFHNDSINIHHAQLVFNTHNPIFLNSNLYRRDEIKFVDRDDDTHFSELYSLSDFGTDGKSSARKNSAYMKNYFVDRYGAIKDVDFSPIFKALVNKAPKEEEQNA